MGTIIPSPVTVAESSLERSQHLLITRRPYRRALRSHRRAAKKGGSMRAECHRSEFKKVNMQPNEAVERIYKILAHAWMVRNFLKHADEIQEDNEMLAVPRTIFDYIRALEGSYQRGDSK